MLLSSFIPFKSTVKNVMTSRLLNTADLVLPTKASIAIACSVYQSSITYRPDNEISSFKSTGLFPPSLVNMTKCLDVNSTGGARGDRLPGSKITAVGQRIRGRRTKFAPETVHLESGVRAVSSTEEIASRNFLVAVSQSGEEINRAGATGSYDQETKWYIRHPVESA
ncbi:hypothetical protein PC112_g14088 [Phytophthora cactorum]|nr:hypothetical protein PC112_g14088 [Phytophthora cactorum]